MSSNTSLSAGAAFGILLLGCLNLAGLQVARVFRRSGELGVRRALGAGAGRILRQLVLEPSILAGAAAAVALAVAWTAARLLTSWLPPGLPGLEHAGVSRPVLLFLAAGTSLAVLVVGLLPAVRGLGVAAPPSSGRRATQDRARVRLQGGLLVAQVALAVVLAVGAGLLGRSMENLRAVPLGYDTRYVLTIRVSLPSQRYDGSAAHQDYAGRVRERLAALPGVTAAAYASTVPLATGMGTGLGLRAAGSPEEAEGLGASWLQVSPEFFEAMGIRLLAGGPPTPGGPAGADMGGIVIDRTAARRLFGDERPVGREIEVVGRRGLPARVVGVAEDIRLRGIVEEARPVAYGSVTGAWLGTPTFVVRSPLDPAKLVPLVKEVLAEVDPFVPPFEVRTTGEALAADLAARRAVTSLSGLFGVAALLLVALGLYGMVAQGVATRRRELGIRLALGAAVARVVGDTVGRAVALVAAGAAIGLPAALLLARLLRSLLYGVGPDDPGVLAGVVTVVLSVGALAALLPASRAGRIDPAESLRAE